MDVRWSTWGSRFLLVLHLWVVYLMGTKGDETKPSTPRGEDGFPEQVDYDYDADDFNDLFHHDHDSFYTEKDADGKTVTRTVNENIFYFFEEHDFNEDRQLDGTELLQAMYHEEVDELADFPENHPNHKHRTKIENWRIKRKAALVDKALESYDLNKDGYFSWPEFAKAADKLSLVSMN